MPESSRYYLSTKRGSLRINAPGQGESSNDCFTITYEGESVNPCVDVTRAPEPVSAPENIVPACVQKSSSLVRIVQPAVACRMDEYRVELLMATPEAPDAARSAGVPEAFRFRDR